MKRWDKIIQPEFVMPKELRRDAYRCYLEKCNTVSECHGCGVFRRGNIHVNLSHLCQHFFSLCPDCMEIMLNKLGVEKLEGK